MKLISGKCADDYIGFPKDTYNFKHQIGLRIVEMPNYFIDEHNVSVQNMLFIFVSIPYEDLITKWIKFKSKMAHWSFDDGITLWPFIDQYNTNRFYRNHKDELESYVKSISDSNWIVCSSISFNEISIRYFI